MTEIYCNSCVYLEVRDGDVGGGVGYFCKTYHTEHKTSISLSFPLKECSDVNKDNDCKAYRRKPKWYIKLKFWRSK